MNSLLRRLWKRGYKISLSYASGKPEVIILTDDKLSDLWLYEAAPILSRQLSQIKAFGHICSNDVDKFFFSNGILFEEMSDDQWLVNYKMVGVQ